MALIRWPEGQQRSGALGGSVYSRNRYGAYIRPRTVPVNPLTARQYEVRQALAAAQAKWAALTDEQRQLWQVYADAVSWRNRFGDTVKLTAQAHFLRCASVARYTRVGTGYDDAPVDLRLPAADETVGFTIAAGGPTVTVSFGAATDPWKSVVGAYLLLFIGRERSPRANYYGGPWAYLGKVAGAATPPSSPQTFTNPFGTFAGEGNLVSLRWRVLLPTAGLSEPTSAVAAVGEPV